jgi:hypothetical protein
MVDHDPLSTQEILQTDTSFDKVQQFMQKQIAKQEELLIASREEAARLERVEALKQREIELHEQAIKAERETQEMQYSLLLKVDQMIQMLHEMFDNKPFERSEQKMNAVISAMRVLADLVLSMLGRDIRAEDRAHLERLYHLAEQAIKTQTDYTIHNHNTSAGHDVSQNVKIGS